MIRLHIRRARPAILMYHRVASVRHDPWGLAVHPRRFAEQIAYLRRSRLPMSMTELVERLRTNTLPHKAVGVTFDDGYRDNVAEAKPVLGKHRVPATFFLATGFVGVEESFWWDELCGMMLDCTDPVEQIEMIADEAVLLRWDQQQASDLAGKWRAGQAPQTDRQRCYLAVWARLQRADAGERERVLRAFRRQFRSASNPHAMPMNAGEIKMLVSDELLQLGAHSVGHPMLTSLTPLERSREIRKSAEACHALSGKTPRGFAYPYGDVDAETSEDVRSAGFDWACSTRNGFLDEGGVDFYALPRIAVPDVPLRQFRRILEQ